MRVKFNDGRGNTLDKNLSKEQIQKLCKYGAQFNGNPNDYDFTFRQPQGDERPNCREGYVLAIYAV